MNKNEGSGFSLRFIAGRIGAHIWSQKIGELHKHWRTSRWLAEMAL